MLRELIILSSILVICTATLELTEDGILPVKTTEAKAGDHEYKKKIIDSSGQAIIKFKSQGVKAADFVLEKRNEKDQSYSVQAVDGSNIKISQIGSSINVTFSGSLDVSLSGVYKLSVKGDASKSATGKLLSQPIIEPVTSSKRGLEKDTMDFKCIVNGYPLVDKVFWVLPNTTAKLTSVPDKFELLVAKDGNNVNGSRLVIKALSFDYDGNLKCSAKNSQGEDEIIIQVRVRDRWAALYPFIGIVIEVIVLVIAILYYERQRSKTRSNNSNNATENNATNNRSGDAEQRQALTTAVDGAGDREGMETHNRNAVNA